MTVEVRTYALAVAPCWADGGFVAYFPSLPGCQAWGRTFQQALRNAETALLAHIEELRRNGEPVPDETAPGVVSLGVTVRTPVIA
jgi:predicted RNase H-like HicB family nuclease